MNKNAISLLIVIISLILLPSTTIAQIKAFSTDSIITHQREALFHTVTLSETRTNNQINLLCYGSLFGENASLKFNYTTTYNSKVTKEIETDINNISFSPSFVSHPIITFYLTPEKVIYPSKNELKKWEVEQVKNGEIAFFNAYNLVLYRISSSKYQILRINKIEVSNMPYDAFLFPNTDIRNYKYNRD